MKVTHYSRFQPIDAAEIEKAYVGVTIRRVISENDGAGDFVLDIFEIAPGGQTPYHNHPWEHEIFVISGHGQCRDSTGEHPFAEGDVIHVGPGESHAFSNSGPEFIKLVCVVPKAALTAYHLTKLHEDVQEI
jgi:quercetin dioxygenase-like cupin family protein